MPELLKSSVHILSHVTFSDRSRLSHLSGHVSDWNMIYQKSAVCLVQVLTLHGLEVSPVQTVLDPWQTCTAPAVRTQQWEITSVLPAPSRAPGSITVSQWVQLSYTPSVMPMWPRDPKVQRKFSLCVFCPSCFLIIFNLQLRNQRLIGCSSVVTHILWQGLDCQRSNLEMQTWKKKNIRGISSIPRSKIPQWVTSLR